MRKFLFLMLCAASLCCAQLMSAAKASNPEGDASKTLKVRASVNYDMLVYTPSDSGETKAGAGKKIRARRIEKNPPYLKKTLTTAGEIIGMLALGTLTGVVPVPSLNIANTVYSLDEIEMIPVDP